MAARQASSTPAQPVHQPLGAIRALVCCSDQSGQAQRGHCFQSDSSRPVPGRFGLAMTVAFGGAPGIATWEGVLLKEARVVWETGVLVPRRWFKCMAYSVHNRFSHDVRTS